MNRKTISIYFIFALPAIFAIISIKNFIPSFSYSAEFRQTPAPSEISAEFLNRQQEEKPKEVSLIAVGDISFSRGVERIIKIQNDASYPLLKVRDYFLGADLVWGNLESPIIAGREIRSGEMIFRATPGTEKVLREAGIGLLSLANNHAFDFREQGQKDTLKYLEQAGLKYVGVGHNPEEAYQPAIIDLKGIKIAFLNYADPGPISEFYKTKGYYKNMAFMENEKMTAAVREAKQKADFVIVSMHAGIEYVNKPNALQVNFAHSAINAGADMVIGHHPHVVQVMEKYKDKYIFYSLGNFVFDQMWSQATKEGLAVKIYFTKNEIGRISFLPVIIENFSQPRIADEAEAKKILKKLNFPLNEKNEL